MSLNPPPPFHHHYDNAAGQLVINFTTQPRRLRIKVCALANRWQWGTFYITSNARGNTSYQLKRIS